jgi:recombination protein RecA
MAKKIIDKVGTLESLIESMNTTFKDGDFAIALEKDFISKLDWLSSGNYAINFACTGSPYRAIPFGRIVSFVGDSGSGKSLLANHFLAETQKIGGIGVLFDVERANYIQQLNKLGIDSSKLIISGSKILEDIFEKAIAFVKSYKEKNMTAPLTIVIDSLSQASSRHEMEEGFDKSDMKRAQVIRKGLRMISGLISDNKVCLIIINHLTSNIGNPYGPAKSPTGGSAVEYFPSQVIDVGRGKTIKNDAEIPIGLEVRIRIAKSRFFVPFVTARVQIYFDRGFEPTSGLFEMLEQSGAIIKVSQAGWWQFKDQVDKDKKYRETEIFEMIKADINKYLKLIENIKVSAVGVDNIEYSEKVDKNESKGYKEVNQKE